LRLAQSWAVTRGCELKCKKDKVVVIKQHLPTHGTL